MSRRHGGGFFRFRGLTILFGHYRVLFRRNKGQLSGH